MSHVERDLLGLPARMGGLGLLNPAVEAETAHTSACKVTKPLVDSLLGRTECPMAEVFSDQNTASIESRRAKTGLLKNRSTSVKDCLPHKMQRAVLAAEEKCASSWLTALPLADFGFSLSKSDFRDALHLCYGWTPPRLPTACVCGPTFSHRPCSILLGMEGTWDSGTTRYGTCLLKYWKILVLTSVSSRP